MCIACVELDYTGLVGPGHGPELDQQMKIGAAAADDGLLRPPVDWVQLSYLHAGSSGTLVVRLES